METPFRAAVPRELPKPARPRAGLGATIAIALTVVLICLLIWVVVRRPTWGHLAYWKAHFKESPDQILDRSDGTFDEEARLALERTRARLENPNIQGAERLRDHNRISRIIRFAMLPAELLNLFNRGGGARARLQNLSRQLEMQRREILTRMLETNEAFELQDRMATELLLEVDGLQNLGLLGVDDTIAPLMRVKEKNVKRRREEAKELGETAGAQAEIFLDLSQTHTNDPESVHDPSVVADLRHIIRNLKRDTHTAALAREVTVGEIIDNFRENSDEYSKDPRTGRPRPLLTSRDVVPVLEFIRDSGASMLICSGMSEPGELQTIQDEEVLRLVWARTQHPNNLAEAGKMRQALYDAMIDCWKEGIEGPKIICVQGRIGRMVGSLAHHDFDTDNWEIDTFEAISNEIMEAAKEVLRAMAEKTLQDKGASNGEKLAAGELLAKTPEESEQYTALFGKPDPKAEAELHGRITRAMLKKADELAAVHNARAPGRVSDSALMSIKKDLNYVLN